MSEAPAGKQLKTSRREAISKANSTVFIMVAIAAGAIMFSVVSSRFLWDQKSYNDRVIAAKTDARNAITSNLESLEKLSAQFPDLQSGVPTATTILNALPPTYDYAGLTTSVNFLATGAGVSFMGSVGSDESASAVRFAPTSEPIEIPVSLGVAGTYRDIRQFILDLERSIRPFHVISVDYSGTRQNLNATINAVTYYQPARSLDVLKEEVQ